MVDLGVLAALGTYLILISVACDLCSAAKRFHTRRRHASRRFLLALRRGSARTGARGGGSARTRGCRPRPQPARPWSWMADSPQVAQRVWSRRRSGMASSDLKLDEDTADFLDVFVLADQMLVAKQVAKAEFTGFALSLGAGVKWAIFGPQLLGGVTGHPKGLFVGHSVCPGRSVKCSSQAKYLSRNREFPVRQTYGAIMLPSWRI